MEKELTIGDSLLISLDQLDSAVTKRLLYNLTDDQRSLTIEEITLQDQIQIISGNLNNITWSIPGILPTIIDLYLTIRVEYIAHQNLVQIEKISGVFTLDNEHVPFIGRETKTGEILLHIDSESSSNLTWNKIYTLFPATNNQIENILSTQEQLLSSDILIGLEGGFMTLLHSTTFQLNSQFIPLLKNGIADDSTITFTHFLPTGSAPTPPLHSWFAQGNFTIKNSPYFSIRPSLNGGMHADLFSGDNGLPSLSEIADFFGFHELSGKLASSFEALPFFKSSLIDELTLSQLSFTIGTDRSSFIDATISGSTKLDNYQFNFSFTLPHFSLNLALEKTTPIPVNVIVNSFFPGGVGLSDGMEISQLEGSINTEPLSIEFGLSVKNIWKFDIGKTPFELQEVSVSFLKRRDQNSRGSIRALLQLGSVDFQLSAANQAESSSEGWLFETIVAQNAGISLKNIVSQFAEWFHFESPKDLPNITLNDIHLSFHTKSHEFRLSGTAILEENFGALQKGEITLSVGLSKEQGDEKHTLEIILNGSITINQAVLAFEANFGTSDWGFHLNWNETEGVRLNLLELVHAIDPNADLSSIPQEVTNAFTISSADLSYQHNNREISMSMSTKGGEHAVFSAQKPNGKLDVLLGVGYKKAEDLPTNLGSQLSNIKNIDLNELWFLVGKLSSGNSLPELPIVFPFDFKTNDSEAFIKLMAVLDLESGHSHPGLASLKEHLPDPELILIAAITEKKGEVGITLKAELSGDLEIPLSDENVLALEDCYLQFDYHDSLFEIILGGTMHFVIDHLPISPSLQLIVSNHGLEAEVDLTFGDDIHEGWHPFGIEGLTVDKIGLLLGIDFETSGIEFGLFGKFSITDQKHGSEAKKNNIDFGIVLEMIGEVPNPEYFALNIQEIDFTELAKLFIGTSKDGTNSITSTLKGENLSIYWAEKVLTLPDGTKTNPLFGLHGEFDIFGWKAYAHLDVHADSGIRGDAQTDKIDWGIFQLSGNGKELIIYKDNQGNIVSNADIRNRSEDQTVKPFTIVHAGGPVIHFDSSTSPFLNASIHARLLSFIHAELDAEITNTGFLFNLHFEIEHITNFRLHCELKEGTDLTVDGNFFAGIQLEPLITAFNPFPIELGVFANIHLHVNAAEPQKFQLSLNGGLDVMGVEIPFVAVNVKDFPEDAKLIPLWLAVTFTENIFPGLHELFQKAYDELKSQHKPFDEAKYAAALELLDFAEAWKTFVEEDIEELNRELHTSAQTARDLAKKITNQLGTTRNEGNSLNNNVKAKHVSETKRLDEQAKQVVDQSLTIRQKTFDRNAIWIANHRREIREIKDEQTLLRSTINAFWDEHVQEFSSAKTPSEFHLKLIEVSELVQQRVEALKLPIPDEHLTSFENGEHLHRTNATNDDYNHFLNVEARYQLYPEISGKYTPQAVNHHATMIRTERVSSARELAITWEAEQQATTIIERALEEMRAFSASN